MIPITWTGPSTQGLQEYPSEAFNTEDTFIPFHSLLSQVLYYSDTTVFEPQWFHGFRDELARVSLRTDHY